MPIYKYTIKKYVKSYSTWIIMLVTLIIIIFGVGVLPFQVFPPKNTNDYSKRVLILIPSMTGFLAIFSSVFSGFKAANMYKDEVEDGTFLIIISKPITRKKIIISKWLALQTFLLMYAIFTSGSEALVILIFDNGDNVINDLDFLGLSSLKNKAFVIFGFTTIILYVISLSFSSIAILLSSRLSVSSTLGIVITIAVIFPITRLVYTFTKKEEIIPIIGSSFFKNTDPFKEIDEKNLQKFQDLKGVINIFSDSKDKGRTKSLNDKEKDTFRNVFESLDYKKIRDSYHKGVDELSKDPNSIYEIGYLTGDKNTYANLWFLDTNFQMTTKLSSFIFDEIIPKKIQQSGVLSRYDRSTYLKNIKTINFPEINKSKLWAFNERVQSSWEKTKEIRANLLSLWLALFMLNSKKIRKIIDKQPNTISYIRFREGYLDIKNQGLKPEQEKSTKFTFGKSIAGDKDFFLKIAEAINIIRESNPQSNFDAANRLIELYRFVFRWRWLIPFVRQNLREDDKSTMNLIFWISNYLNDFLFPIESMYWGNIDKIAKEKKADFSQGKNIPIEKLVQIPDILKNGTKNKTKYDFTKVYNYMLLRNFGSYREKYAKIYNFVVNNSKFGNYAKKGYVSKYTVLGMFITVSIVLIPLSYLAIRKKDFR